MRRFIWGIIGVIACGQMAWADLARPETLEDTLIAMRDHFLADSRVSDTHIELEQRYLSFHLQGGPMQISLPDTIHKTLQDAPNDAARERALLQFIEFTVGASHSVLPDGPLESTQIFPILRPTGFGVDPLQDAPDLEDYGAEEDTEEAQSAPVSLPFTADMEILFAHDNGQVIQLVTAHHLEQLELDPQALLKRARVNLLEREWDLKINDGDGDGLYILSIDGNFETSFMLNTPFWQGVDVGLGSIVAIVVARDLVLFVDGDVAGAIEGLRGLVVSSSLNRVPNPISTMPLIWKNGTWHSLE